MKEFLRYILFICMTFAFLPIATGALRQLGPPFITIADYLEIYTQVIWMITGFFGGASGILLVSLQWKERRANEVVAKATARDDFWDEKNIEHSCRLAFYSVFDGISTGDLTQMEPFVTPEFSRKIMPIIAEPVMTQSEIINPVDITDTKIVAGIDRIENNLDEVIVCLKGDFVRPADGTHHMATNFKVEKTPFQILCTLRRQGQVWKLDKIDDHVSLLDLLFRTRNKYEPRKKKL